MSLDNQDKNTLNLEQLGITIERLHKKFSTDGGSGGYLAEYLTKAEASETYVAKSDTPISDSVIRTLPTQKGTLTYNGNEQSPEWQDFDPLKLAIDTDVSTLAATNAGNYPVGFIPLEPNTWENGGTNTVMTTWSIGKAAGFAILSATAGTFNYIPYTRTFSLYSATGTVSATSDDTDVAIVSMVNATTVSVTSSNKGGTANINVDVAEDDNHLAANVGIYKATVVNLKKLTLFANPVTCTYLEEATIYLKGNLGGGEISATSTYPDYVAITGITSDTITVRCLQYRSGNNQIKLNIQPSGDYTSATYTCSVYLQKEPSIVKKPNQLALSAESGTVVYGESLTFYVTENLSGGELSYSTQKNAVTASITNDGTDCTVTITPKNCYYVQEFITITSAATDKYLSESVTFTAFLKKAVPELYVSTSTTLIELDDSIGSAQIKVISNSNGKITLDIDNPLVCYHLLAYPELGIKDTYNIGRRLRGSAMITLKIDETSNYLAREVAQTVYVRNTRPANQYIFFYQPGENVYMPQNSFYTLSTEQLLNAIKSGGASKSIKVGDHIRLIDTYRDEHNNIRESPESLSRLWRYNSPYSRNMPCIVDAICIGVDHNPKYEGYDRLHFAICKKSHHEAIGAYTACDGVNIPFAFYKKNVRDLDYATNQDGWSGSTMREWLNTTFYDALPEMIQEVISPCTKYTDNIGCGTTTAENVTATKDKIWLLSEYEIFGSRTYANEHEQQKQAQYEYFKTVNPIVYAPDGGANAIGSHIDWWTRSPNCNNNTDFVSCDSDGTVSTANTNVEIGWIPCFTIA